MAKTARDLLLETLENLGEKQFKRFKGKLNDWEVPDGYRRIPRNQLEKADEDDVADLIIRSYTESYGIEVALGVLAAIGEMDPHEKLHKSWQKVAASTPPVKPGADSQRVTPTDGQHFVHRHQVALIKRVSHIDPVLDGLLGDGTLTQEEYDTVRSKGTPQERMRQLYDCVRAWGKIEKDKFYQYLLEENGPLVRDLENN
uniref:PYD and CARD domain containing n=1 Tax=Xenopus tropicalis TaxID=8364 RepID=A0A803K1T7_XENTR